MHLFVFMISSYSQLIVFLAKISIFTRKKHSCQNAPLLGKNGIIDQDFNHHICVQTRELLSSH